MTTSIVHRHPDQFFIAQQQQRLAELMQCWRAARDAGGALPDDEQTELDALIETELRAATARAAALLQAYAQRTSNEQA